MVCLATFLATAGFIGLLCAPWIVGPDSARVGTSGFVLLLAAGTLGLSAYLSRPSSESDQLPDSRRWTS
jgi:hypothetical protein